MRSKTYGSAGFTPVFERQSFRAELRKSGFREKRRTYFVWEGVSMYLTRTSVKKSLETMRAMSAAGSHVVLDLWVPPRRAGSHGGGAPLLRIRTPPQV